MKIFLRLLPAFLPIFLFSMGHTRYSQTPDDLRVLAASDYQRLWDFSNQMEVYGITENRFEEFLWEGAVQALEFYESQLEYGPKFANQNIRRHLWEHPNLRHPIPLPMESKAITPNLAFEALNRFSTNWYGKWQTQEVQHKWLPVQEFKKEMANGYTLIGFQSCFTGDGVGWNYVVQKKETTVILGFVYHFDEYGTISFQNPHYALLNMDGQLTWVSNDHMYFEFVCQDPSCGDSKHYVITGGKYEKQDNALQLVTGFQAIYARRYPVPPSSFSSLPLPPTVDQKPLSKTPISNGLLKIYRGLKHRSKASIAAVKGKIYQGAIIAKLVQYLQ